MVSCLTNLLLAVIVSKNVSLYVPSSWSAQLGTIEGKVRLVVLVWVAGILKAISAINGNSHLPCERLAWLIRTACYKRVHCAIRTTAGSPSGR